MLSAKEFKLKTWKTLSPTHKKASYGAMLGAMCEMYGGKRVGETLAWEEVLSFYIQFVLGPAKEFKLKPQKLWAPTTKKLRMVPCWGQCAGCMGEKWLEKHWPERKCCLFTFSLCLGQQRNFSSKPEKLWVLCLGQQRNLNSKPQELPAPPTKNTLYGAMLGAMFEMYGGKRVGETLAWEEVLSFYIQFVLGPAKEFKLKPQKLWAPTTKKLRMVPCWGQCAGCMGEKWLEKHWLERKCCLFTFSLCLGQQRNFSSKPEKLWVLRLGQQRNLNSKPQELPAPPTKTLCMVPC